MSLEIKVNTRDFGEIDIENDKIFEFPEGIFAFEDYHKFALLSPLGSGTYPMWLQSLEEKNICFIVFNPIDIMVNYSPKIDAATRKALGLNADDKISYLVIAVVPDDYKKTTINLKSPIIVNPNNGRAAQIILEENYQIKFPILNPEPNELEEI